MIQSATHRSPLGVAAGLMALGVCLAPVPAPATSFKGRSMTMPELVKASDEIVHGVVENTQGVWRNGRVETDTTIVVQEGFKGKKYSLGPGKRSMDKASAPRVRVTTIGGTPPGSPVTQHAGFTPVFAPDEEVILFLKYPEGDMVKRDRALAAVPNSKLPTSPRIVGYFQGKFTVYSDEFSGQKRVARLVLDTYNVLPSSETMRSALKALRTNQLKITSGPLVAKRPEDAPPMGQFGPILPAAGKDKSPRTAAMRRLAESAAGNPITVMPFDDFVNQIKESAK